MARTVSLGSQQNSSSPHQSRFAAGGFMTTATLVFDPFSEDFFTDPYETYRRMRAEAPVYYSEQYDFYALTRHEDVAAAFKDYETYSSSRGIDLGMVRKGEVPARLVIMMDPPDHRRMRSLVNKVFTPRAIESQRPMVTEQIERFCRRSNGRIRRGAGLLGTVPRRGDRPHARGARGESAADPAVARQPASRESGKVEMSEAGMKAGLETGMYYYNLIQERRAELSDDMISGSSPSEVERDDGTRRLDTSRSLVRFAVGRRGGGDRDQVVGNAVVMFAENPDQWQMLLDDRSKIPAAVEELLRFEAPAQYNVRCSLPEGRFTASPSLRQTRSAGGRFGESGSGGVDRSGCIRHRPRPHRGAEPRAGLRHSQLPGRGAGPDGERDRVGEAAGLHAPLRNRLEWLRRVAMPNVAGWSNVPVRVLR